MENYTYEQILSAYQNDLIERDEARVLLQLLWKTQPIRVLGFDG
jgi:hypothetical protein